MVVSFRSTTTSLVCHHKNLWTYDGSLTALYGIFRLPSRMTIICSEEINKLGIISPFPPTDTIKNLIDEIVKSFVFGEAKYIVVPNKHHTWWALAFLTTYPNAYLIATEGVRFDESVEILYEVVFYHISLSTLILTDLAFNYSEIDEQVVPAEGYLFRLYLWLTDGYHQNDFDQLMNRYKNFRRLIMAHGTIIPYNGYQSFKLGIYTFFMDLYNKEKQTKHKSSSIN